MLVNTEASVSLRTFPFRYGPGYDLTPKPKKKTKIVVNETIIKEKIQAKKKLLEISKPCIAVKDIGHNVVNTDLMTDDFKNSSFVEQSNHIQMRSVPLLSQLARQHVMHPSKSDWKKELYLEISEKLGANDSNFIRARLCSEAVDDAFIKLLEESIRKNTRLQHLSLHDNLITDEGIETLCLALRHHPSLHTLWIGANRYSDVGARHFSQLLQHNRTIKDLNISNRWEPQILTRKTECALHPHISYLGAQYLARQLQFNCGLTSLSLAD